MIRGNKRSPDNVFGWKKAVLNLPDTFKYDPTMPWIYKMGIACKVASNLYFYVDDVRLTVGSEEAS